MESRGQGAFACSPVGGVGWEVGSIHVRFGRPWCVDAEERRELTTPLKIPKKSPNPREERPIDDTTALDRPSRCRNPFFTSLPAASAVVDAATLDLSACVSIPVGALGSAATRGLGRALGLRPCGTWASISAAPGGANVSKTAPHAMPMMAPRAMPSAILLPQGATSGRKGAGVAAGGMASVAHQHEEEGREVPVVLEGTTAKVMRKEKQ